MAFTVPFSTKPKQFKKCDVICENLSYGWTNGAFFDQLFPYVHTQSVFLNCTKSEKVFSEDAYDICDNKSRHWSDAAQNTRCVLSKHVLFVPNLPGFSPMSSHMYLCSMFARWSFFKFWNKWLTMSFLSFYSKNPKVIYIHWTITSITKAKRFYFFR